MSGFACPCGCGGIAYPISSDGDCWRCYNGNEHGGSFRNEAYAKQRAEEANLKRERKLEREKIVQALRANGLDFAADYIETML